MEMQQIRYFLALSETLNFTKAAAQCNVTQPALTRAVKMLEGELGGELIRREGKLSTLTHLGIRMRPLLQQCYEGVLSAKALARSVAGGQAQSLSLGLSRTVNLRMLEPVLSELFQAYPTLQLKIKRGNGAQLIEYLRNDEIDVAIAGPLRACWDRVDSYVMFSEAFDLALSPTHRLAGPHLSVITFADLAKETFLLQCDSETSDEETRHLTAAGISLDRRHIVDSDEDIAALVAANIGVAVLPRSTLRGGDLCRRSAPELNLRRNVALYTVQGRARSLEAASFIGQIQARTWTHPANDDRLNGAQALRERATFR